MQCRAGRDWEVIRPLHCPRAEGFMESVVAWVKAGRGNDPGGERGRPPGLGCGQGGKTAVSGSLLSLQSPRPGLRAQEFWSLAKSR